MRDRAIRGENVLACLAVCLLGGCIGYVEEPVSHDDYHVRNLGTVELHVEATENWTNEPVGLLNDVVPPGETVHIHSVTEGSGGHTFPSNFFETFTVRAGDEVVYEGVENGDWMREELLGLVLTIEP